MTSQKTQRISVLLSMSTLWGREVIEGITQYLHSTRTSWELFVEELTYDNLKDLRNWQGDGFITTVDDARITRQLIASGVPVVGLGCSFADPARYPDMPYVCYDDRALVWACYQHLVGRGLRNFAMFSLPATATHGHWALEREHHFKEFLERDGLSVAIHRGRQFNTPSWGPEGSELADWVRSLPKPVGIIAVNDERARQLLQACLAVDIAVPSQVAIIGIDDDPLARVLTRVPLSSVRQPTQEIGRQAAQLLHQMLGGLRLPAVRVVLPPAGINEQASSLYDGAYHPYVMRARHYIRQYASGGIHSDQVAGYVGVGRSTLDMHFRRELGITVHEELLRVRLKMATDLLGLASLPLAEVARRSGFKSVQYMYTVFRRELDCTPLEYRRLSLAGQAVPVADVGGLAAAQAQPHVDGGA